MTQQRTRDIVRQRHQSGLSKSALIIQLAADFHAGRVPNNSRFDHDTYARRYVEKGFKSSKKMWINDPPTGLPRKK